MSRICYYCKVSTATIKRPKNGDLVCKECFFEVFENEIHRLIINERLFEEGERIAIATSGGKDSTVLAHIMVTLNQRYNYKLDLILLSIDEGIKGYRDDSLETVKSNKEDYSVPLKILSYEELYGWTMDEIVSEIGGKNNCTFCGVFRRQALDRGSVLVKADKIVTGHNADDIAETVLMNILRGDISRLKRCTSITTGSKNNLPRSKPLKYTYEKEIVMYAHYKKLKYFSTECSYSPNAYRGYAREFLKDLERLRPSAILDIIHAGETMAFKKDSTIKVPVQMNCIKCGYMSSNRICQACSLLEGLNNGKAKLSIRRDSTLVIDDLVSVNANVDVASIRGLKRFGEIPDF